MWSSKWNKNTGIISKNIHLLLTYIAVFQTRLYKQLYVMSDWTWHCCSCCPAVHVFLLKGRCGFSPHGFRSKLCVHWMQFCAWCSPKSMKILWGENAQKYLLIFIWLNKWCDEIHCRAEIRVMQLACSSEESCSDATHKHWEPRTERTNSKSCQCSCKANVSLWALWIIWNCIRSHLKKYFSAHHRAVITTFAKLHLKILNHFFIYLLVCDSNETTNKSWIKNACGVLE